MDQTTGELNESLMDLLGKSEYRVEFFIRPLNLKDYELTGSLTCALPEDCSRCGLDFNLKLSESLHDVLVPHHEPPRGGFYARVNHLSDQEEKGITSHTYKGNVFDLGEYIHEVIALATPFNPNPASDKKGNCLRCGVHVPTHQFGIDENRILTDERKSPFSVLKTLKVHLKN